MKKQEFNLWKRLHKIYGCSNILLFRQVPLPYTMLLSVILLKLIKKKTIRGPMIP